MATNANRTAVPLRSDSSFYDSPVTGLRSVVGSTDRFRGLEISTRGLPRRLPGDCLEDRKAWQDALDSRRRLALVGVAVLVILLRYRDDKL